MYTGTVGAGLCTPSAAPYLCGGGVRHPFRLQPALSSGVYKSPNSALAISAASGAVRRLGRSPGPSRRRRQTHETSGCLCRRLYGGSNAAADKCLVYAFSSPVSPPRDQHATPTETAHTTSARSATRLTPQTPRCAAARRWTNAREGPHGLHERRQVARITRPTASKARRPACANARETRCREPNNFI